MQSKRGQVTIFIIIAIVLVAIVAGFFLVRNLLSNQVPSSLNPPYEYMISCVENKILQSVKIMQSQGGYLQLPELEQGSYNIPFSSQLDFMGKIPYWYYISGSGLEKQQVPTKDLMENQLEQVVEESLNECDFQNFFSQGFEIELGEPSSTVSIKEKSIDVALKLDFSISKGEEKVLIKTHKISVSSDFGGLYNSAVKVYDYQNENLFLERYAIDVLRFYAPVDGAEISCSPKIWVLQAIFSEIRGAVEANTFFLKKGTKEYFSVDIPVNEEVKFLSFQNWPMVLESAPSKGNFLVAEPVGNQPGLGVLGFCYVPYHFVYDLKYPVLIQIKKGDEIFQFPIVVVIEKNVARKSLATESVLEPVSEICSYKNTPIQVKVVDYNNNPVEAKISYDCLNEMCEIGQTSSGVLQENFPQCNQGKIIVEAQGFETEDYIFSTIDSGNVQISLDKIYPVEIDLQLNGVSVNNKALISFISEDKIQTLVYPENKIIELSAGNYELDVSVYETSEINLQETTSKQCLEVSSGLGGLLGLTQQKCFDLTFPAQTVSEAICGGGSSQLDISESELSSTRIIKINSDKLNIPRNLEELNKNYLLVDSQELEVSLS